MRQLFRVFQIALRIRGIENFGRGGGGGRGAVGWESDEEWLWPFEPFSNLITTFCIYWTSIKTKVSMTFVYKECENKIKMVPEQWLQLKIKFLFGYERLREQRLCEEESTGARIFPSRENPVIPYINANKKNSLYYLENLKN